MNGSSESDVSSFNGPVKTWLYQNIATVLLTFTIALSSLVWQDLVVSMENMRTDIRDLTSKINRVVENQASYGERIEANRQDIRDIEKRLRKLDSNWREQWQSNASDKSSPPNP
jgi:DNA repair ATPase RecN